MAQIGHTGIVKEDDFYDPLLAGEKGNTDGHYNKSEDRLKWKQKKDMKFNQK